MQTNAPLKSVQATNIHLISCKQTCLNCDSLSLFLIFPYHSKTFLSDPKEGCDKGFSTFVGRELMSITSMESIQTYIRQQHVVSSKEPQPVGESPFHLIRKPSTIRPLCIIMPGGKHMDG